MNQLSPERQGKITSSTAAAALGLHDDMSPIDAWLSITGRAKFDGNKATERGNMLEHTVLDWAATKLDAHWEEAAFRQHPQLAWAGDSVDALFYRGSQSEPTWVGLGEGKTAALSQIHKWGKEDTDQIPEHYLVQCHWHLLHYPEFRLCYVPVLLGGFEFEYRMYRVEKDAEFEQHIVELLAKWHRDHVVADKQPPPTALDLDFMKKKYPYRDGRKKDLMPPTAELEALAKQYGELSEILKGAEESRDDIKAKLCELLGDAYGTKGDGWSVVWSDRKGSEKTNWEHLARELGATPDLIQKHTTQTEGTRSLRVTVKP